MSIDRWVSVGLVLLIFSPWAFAEAEPQLADRSSRTSSRDVKIPQALVKIIDDRYVAYLKAKNIDKKTVIKRSLLNVSVELRQERPAALFESVRVLTPTGGGVIDLAEFVTPVRGAFQLKFKINDSQGNPVADLQTHYVSRAKQRKLVKDAYGVGCSRYLDISNYFQKKNSGSGFTLYTADHRYLSVIAGTFVFFSYSEESLSIASVTFTDSRYPEVLCE